MSTPYVWFLNANGSYTFAPLGAEADGAIVFTDLNDVPASYSGQGLKILRVKSGTNGIEFASPAFVQLSDVPNSFTSNASKYVLVNSAATALEFGYPKGIINGGDAAAGVVGEYKETIVTSGSAVSLTSATAKTVASVSLTSGDWDVEGMVLYNRGASTSVTLLTQGTSLTDNTFEAVPTYTVIPSAAYVPTADPGYNVPARRVSISSTTTVYLIGRGTFTVSTLAGYGFIRARRIR